MQSNYNNHARIQTDGFVTHSYQGRQLDSRSRDGSHGPVWQLPPTPTADPRVASNKNFTTSPWSKNCILGIELKHRYIRYLESYKFIRHLRINLFISKNNLNFNF